MTRSARAARAARPLHPSIGTMSLADARRDGWERVDGQAGKCDARWRHPSGWLVSHCGHPTALRPWAVYDPDGTMHLTGRAPPWMNVETGIAWTTLADAFAYVRWATGNPWVTGVAVDRAGIATYLHIVRAPDDPARRSRKARQDALGAHESAVEWRKLTGRASEASWRENILALLVDGMGRTFNRIAVELADMTADVAYDTAADHALWTLVEEERIEHTTTTPVYFRLRKSPAGRRHEVVIATKPRNARAPAPRSRFECACGAVGKYTTPEDAHAQGDGHVAAFNPVDGTAVAVIVTIIGGSP